MSERLTVGVAARLSRYLQVLTQAKKMGRSSISSQDVSEYTHINATQIRRDLSAFGKFGKRGVGYNIDALIAEIRGILRTSGQHNIALDRRRPARPGDRRLVDLRRPRLPHRHDLRRRPREDRHRAGRRRRSARPATSARRWPSTTSSPPCIAVPAGAAQSVADQLVAGRRAHHLQLLRGAPADARATSSCTARARPSSSCTRSTSTSRRRAQARASAEPRVAHSAIVQAVSSTTNASERHGPQARGPAERRRPGARSRKYDRRERSMRAVSAVRPAAVERMRWYARGDGPEHPRPARGARRGARASSRARRISPSRSRRSSRSSTPRRSASSTASPSSRRAPTRRRSASTRRAS